MSEENERSTPPTLIENLLRRRVIQAMGLYIAMAWGSIEILLTFQDELGWPGWISQLALALFVAGFPIVLSLSYYRDLQSAWSRALVTVGSLSIAGFALWMVLTSSEPNDTEQGPGALPNAAAVVAVLPFDIRGDEAVEAYLSRGFTGELIARLSKVPRLAVVQQSSLDAPMLASLIPAAKAEAVFADYYVEGGIRKEGEFVEVQVWLRDQEGNVLYADTLREPYSASSITSMQRRISTEVGQAVGVGYDTESYCGDTADLDAMEIYYKARIEVLARSGERIKTGIELLKQAVAKDPYYGRAWNMLGEAYAVARTDDIEDAIERETQQATNSRLSHQSFTRALEICPRMGFAYKVTVPNYPIENNWLRHEAEYRDAVAMDPNDGSLLRQYEFFLEGTGRMGEAARIAKRAYQNEPMAGSVVRGWGKTLYFLGDCERALPIAEREIELLKARGTMVKGNCEAEAAAKAEGKTPGPHNDPERAQRMVAMLHEWWSTPEDLRPKQRTNLAVFSAIALDQHDIAFELLDSLALFGGWSADMAGGFNNLWYPMPNHDKFRADPRFIPLMEKVGLTDYWDEYGPPEYCTRDGDTYRCGALDPERTAAVLAEI